MIEFANGALLLVILSRVEGSRGKYFGCSAGFLDFAALRSE